LKFPSSLESQDNVEEAPMQVVFFLGGEISSNFDLQNMISTYTKDFSGKKNDPYYSPDFEKIK
jgi:hypothetical protein